MTVAELIAVLKGFNPDDIVIIVGGDGSYPDRGDFRTVGDVTGNFSYRDEDVGRSEDGFEGEPCVVLFPEQGDEEDG